MFCNVASVSASISIHALLAESDAAAMYGGAMYG